MRNDFSPNENYIASPLFRAIQILFALEEAPEGLTVQEMARVTRLPVSTTYRYVRQLAAVGLVAPVPDSNRYCLGNRLLALAEKVPFDRQLVAAAKPHMIALCRRLGETVLLTKVSGYHAICLERVESQQVVRISFQRGVVLPLHAGASARILMAFMDEREVENVIRTVGLPRYTRDTVTDPQKLRPLLAKVRQLGYAISDGEVDPGVRSVAVPIRDSESRVIAGLSVVGPGFRLPDAKVPRVLAALQETAHAITHELAQPKEAAGTTGQPPRSQTRPSRLGRYPHRGRKNTGLT